MRPGNQPDGDPFDLRAHFRIVCCFAGNVTSAEVTSAYNLRRNLCRCGERPSNINGLTVQCNWTLLRPWITTMQWTEDNAISRTKRRRLAHILYSSGTGRSPVFSGNRRGRKRNLWCFTSTSSQKLDNTFPQVTTTHQLRWLVYMRRWVYCTVLSGVEITKGRDNRCYDRVWRWGPHE